MCNILKTIYIIFLIYIDELAMLFSTRILPRKWDITNK